MTQPAGSFELSIERVHDYELRVRFGEPTLPDLTLDEPPPLGASHGPNPARVLAAAIGSCLGASLIFCLTRAKVPLHGLTSRVVVDLVRNEQRRLRIGKVVVQLRPVVDDPAALTACLAGFEDFCVVTQSVRDGLDVEVSVDPAAP